MKQQKTNKRKKSGYVYTPKGYTEKRFDAYYQRVCAVCNKELAVVIVEGYEGGTFVGVESRCDKCDKSTRHYK